jgi:6-phosphogluconolactonase
MHTDNLHIGSSAEQTAQECADHIAKLLRHGRGMLAISGGSTPKPMFQKLAKSGLDWSKIHVFFVDERCVPPDHEASNYRMANVALFEASGIPRENIHRIQGELEPAEGARKYVEEITAVFGLKPGELPIFDVVHRGMGADAHTASLFPGEPLIADRTGIAANVWVEKLNMARVTLLPGVLLAAHNTVLQVAGADKADALYDVLYGPEDLFRYPCQIATREGDLAVWFLDQAAAQKISNR